MGFHHVKLFLTALTTLNIWYVTELFTISREPLKFRWSTCRYFDEAHVDIHKNENYTDILNTEAQFNDGFHQVQHNRHMQSCEIIRVPENRQFLQRFNGAASFLPAASLHWALPTVIPNRYLVLDFLGTGSHLYLTFHIYEAVNGYLVWRSRVMPPPLNEFRVVIIGPNFNYNEVPILHGYVLDVRNPYQFYIHQRLFESWGGQTQEYRTRHFIPAAVRFIFITFTFLNPV